WFARPVQDEIAGLHRDVTVAMAECPVSLQDQEHLLLEEMTMEPGRLLPRGETVETQTRMDGAQLPGRVLDLDRRARAGRPRGRRSSGGRGRRTPCARRGSAAWDRYGIDRG